MISAFIINIYRVNSSYRQDFNKYFFVSQKSEVKNCIGES